jgi:hypothetical protein
MTEMSKADFIRLLYGNAPDGYVEVTYIAPGELNVSPKIVTQWAALPLNRDIDPDMPVLMHHNTQGYGVYLGMTVRSRTKPKGKRGTKADARYVTHLWCDLDDVDESEGLAILALHDIPPSVIVSSGGGVHGYWLLSEPVLIENDGQRDDIEQTLQGLSLSLGAKADKSVRDLARVLRMPGTVNTKPKRGGVFCEVLSIVTQTQGEPIRYDYADLAAAYMPLGTPAQARIMREIPASAFAQQDGLPTPVQNYLASGAGRGERNNTLFHRARLCNDYGIALHEVEAQLVNRAVMDGLPEHEARAVVSSAYGYAPDVTKRVNSRFASRMAASDSILRKRGA